jgi:hypothetical protein
VLRKTVSAFIFFLLSFSLYPEKLKLVISANLAGNLYSCQCGLKKSVGLLKRASYLKENNLTKSILLDIGSSLDTVYDSKKANLIYKTFTKMGYSAIGLGPTDLFFDNLKNFQSKEIPFISSNVLSKTFFSSKNLSRSKIKIKTLENEIFFLSHLSDSELFLLNSDLLKELKILPFKDSISDLNSRDLVILLHKGNLNEAFEIKKKFPEILIISNSSESKSGKNKSTIRDDLEVFHLEDKLGDKLLILEIEIIAKQIKLINSNLVEMDYKKLKDDEGILELFRSQNFKIPE